MTTPLHNMETSAAARPQTADKNERIVRNWRRRVDEARRLARAMVLEIEELLELIDTQAATIKRLEAEAAEATEISFAIGREMQKQVELLNRIIKSIETQSDGK